MVMIISAFLRYIIVCMRCALLPVFCLVCAILLTQCGSSGTLPLIKNLSGTSLVNEGERATIEWSIANADSVTVEGFSQSFSPQSQAQFVALDARTVKLRAFGKGGIKDTSFMVNIRGKKSDSTAIAGLMPVSPTVLQALQSYQKQFPSLSQQSDYAGGLAPQNGAPVTTLKIIRTVIQPAKKLLTLHALPLDVYGNVVLEADAKKIMFSAKTTCTNDMSMNTDAPMIRLQAHDGASISSFGICVEQSSASSAFSQAIQTGLTQFADKLSPDDEVSYITFDHRVLQQFELVSASSVPSLLQTGSISMGGQTALYKALYRTIQTLKKSGRTKKTIIVVSTATDNTSLIYTTRDITETAQAEGIVIHTIAVGPNVDTYSLRYFSEATGGHCYVVNSESASTDIGMILKEIALGDKLFFEVHIPLDAQKQAVLCNGSSLVSLMTGGSAVSGTPADVTRINTPQETFIPAKQFLTVFDLQSQTIEPKYQELLESLARVLRDNPDKSIELIGHADQTEPVPASLGERRATAVRDGLVTRGITQNRIRIRSASSEEPIAFVSSEPWLQSLNRRVEVRWLDPETLPFELIAQTAFTEEDAQQTTDLWAKRGTRSYYELYLNNGVPAYRIKLWGYATFEEAQSARVQLEKRYKTRLVVQ